MCNTILQQGKALLIRLSVIFGKSTPILDKKIVTFLIPGKKHKNAEYISLLRKSGTQRIPAAVNMIQNVTVNIFS